VTDPQDITRLLHQWGAGDHDAGEKLFKLLMPDLRKLAARCLRREHPNHSLQRSELINECFLRLLSAKHVDWRDRGHFFAIVTIKMRRFLIDYARAKKIKPIPLDDLPEGLLAKRNWLEIAVTIDSLLDELEKESPIKCSVVVCRSYMGLSTKETAEMLGLTENSVEHEWHRARLWLYQKLREGRWNSATSGR
jgi:RNA polymerase sigma-70 factor (ECF subfamily)